MIMQLSDALARAALNQRERRVVKRLVVQLGEELGGDLRCVWLYGSRARGEADPSEADPDRRSDIDLMVIADGGECRYGAKVNDLRHEIAWAEGDEPAFFSVFVHDLEWLRDRRQIESFFIQEVDRDKIVLHGSALGTGVEEGDAA